MPPHPQTRPAEKIGYARVSTAEQNLDLQFHALRDAGCNRIFSDTASGAKTRRSGLIQAIAQCGGGDMLVVWKLDRLGRSLIDLVALVEDLRAKNIGLRVLTGQGAMIDTARPEGRMIFGIFATLAEFERELIRERTKAGMDAARARGVHIGRPTKLTPAQLSKARHWLNRHAKSHHEIAAHFHVHVATLRRALRAEKRPLSSSTIQ